MKKYAFNTIIYLDLNSKHNIYTYASSCFYWMSSFCSFATTIKHIDECDRSHILFISLFLISHIRLLTEIRVKYLSKKFPLSIEHETCLGKIHYIYLFTFASHIWYVYG